MASYCLYCDKHIQGEISWESFLFPAKGPALCNDCLEQMQLITGNRCDICSRSLDDLSAEYRNENLCFDCIRWQRDQDWKDILGSNLSLYQYNDFLKEIIAKFKFRGDYELGKVFAPAIRTALKQLEFDLLVPIPLSSERLKERGFNQATALVQLAGFQTNDILIRAHGEKQSKKTRVERLKQTGIFQVKEEAISGKNILLFDDIYTTGTTLRHAAKTLKVAGTEKIYALTLAR